MCSSLLREILTNIVFDWPNIFKMLFNHNVYFCKLLKHCILITVKYLPKSELLQGTQIPGSGIVELKTI